MGKPSIPDAGPSLPDFIHQPQNPACGLATINRFHSRWIQFFPFTLDAEYPFPRLAQSPESFGFNLLLIGISRNGRTVGKEMGNQVQFPASAFRNRANEKPYPPDAKVGWNGCEFDSLMNWMAIHLEIQFKAGIGIHGVHHISKWWTIFPPDGSLVKNPGGKLEIARWNGTAMINNQWVCWVFRQT